MTNKKFFWWLLTISTVGSGFFSFGCLAQALRWNLDNPKADGGISWTVQPGAQHTDHIEMSGQQISVILTYGVDKSGRLILDKRLVYPMLRTIPNDTRGSLTHTYHTEVFSPGKEDGKAMEVIPVAFSINGALSVTARTQAGLKLVLTAFPATGKAAYIERYKLTNTSRKAIQLFITDTKEDTATDPAKGVYGSYILQKKTYHGGDVRLQPGATYDYYIVYSARKSTESDYYYAADYQWALRQQFIQNIARDLVLKTPNDTINRMFDFAKIRSSESIFDTKQGLMHSPGGGDYYGAIWANDEAEYVSPFFPFLGYSAGNASAVNCYRLFARYMNKAYKPIPSSIIAEGDDIWQGAGDRGDQAMIAYGAGQFALAYGDSSAAVRLWPLISWCIAYLEKKKTAAGVIASNSDELEGRFPSGKINLSTNALAYGALKNAARLALALGKKDMAANYRQAAKELALAIDKYFAGNVQGFDTYRYYEGNDVLRSWICLPLVVGLTNRKSGTVKALLSKYLWSKNGILTASGTKTYWDRATLYAFKGLFSAGITDTAYRYFSYYSAMRLLGEHVPYPVEAWPEGDQRHLSAESGLYCRVVTEGLFGMAPVSFNSFYLQPRLPAGWPEMTLEHIRTFQRDFTVKVMRVGEGTGAQEKIIVRQSGQPDQVMNWDQKRPLLIRLK